MLKLIEILETLLHQFILSVQFELKLFEIMLQNYKFSMETRASPGLYDQKKF